MIVRSSVDGDRKVVGEVTNVEMLSLSIACEMLDRISGTVKKISPNQINIMLYQESNQATRRRREAWDVHRTP
jgi:hypothetical protein